MARETRRLGRAEDHFDQAVRMILKIPPPPGQADGCIRMPGHKAQLPLWHGPGPWLQSLRRKKACHRLAEGTHRAVADVMDLLPLPCATAGMAAITGFVATPKNQMSDSYPPFAAGR